MTSYTPYIAPSYTATGQPSNGGRALTGSHAIDEQIARNRWEEHLRATVEQVTWTRRIYWLLWGVIVPPQLILGIWLITQLIA